MNMAHIQIIFSITNYQLSYFNIMVVIFCILSLHSLLSLLCVAASCMCSMLVVAGGGTRLNYMDFVRNVEKYFSYNFKIQNNYAKCFHLTVRGPRLRYNCSFLTI